MPDRLGITSVSAGTREGSARAPNTNPVHTSGELWGSVQPATSVSQAAGADSVRRRLSIIFHMPMTGIRVRRVAAAAVPLMIQGSSCQSPRAQRCCRAAATS